MSALPRRLRTDAAYAERRRRYAENRQYYRGEQPLRGRLRRTGTPRNRVALMVDTVVDHMGGATVTWGPPSAVADAYNAHLERVLEANEAEQLDYDAELACAIDGDVALKVTYDERRGIRLSRVDAAGLWVSWHPADPDDVEMVAQQYELTADDFPVLFPGRLVTRPGGGRKSIVTESWTAERWEVWLDDDLVLSEPNPYGAIPYVVFPNLRVPGGRWGAGDPERLAAIQDRLNAAAADLDWVMEVAAGVTVLEGVDQGGDIAIRPGAVWELPEGARAYMLDMLGSAGVQQRLWHMGDLVDTMHQVARVPQSALGSSGRELSGFALSIELAPLVRLVKRKRLTRTVALRRRAELIAELGRRFEGLPEAGPELRASVTWSEPLPADRNSELRVAMAEVELGRDREAVLAEIGVADPAGELRRHIEQSRLLGADENDFRGEA